MKRVLLATTALFALSGVTVAAADVSLSGHVRFHYDSWSDNVVDEDVTNGLKASANNNNSTSTEAHIWVKGNMVTDSGLTVAPEARIEGDTKGVTRHYIRLSDDWGTIILGNHHSPTYTMSLGADWRGTVSGATAPVAPAPSRSRVITKSGAQITGHGNTKIVYVTPDISGFKAGISFADGGATSKANATEYALQYAMDGMGDGTIKFGYNAASQSAQDSEDDSAKQSTSEYGLEATTGPWLASLVQVNQKETPNKGPVAEKQQGQELEVAYSATDSLTLNLVYFSGKATEGDNKNDTYKSTGIGAKYTIAPGLWASLGYNSFNYTDKTHTAAEATKKGTGNNKGNSLRLRVHAGF